MGEPWQEQRAQDRARLEPLGVSAAEPDEFGQQQGELSFALLTDDSKVTLAPPTTTDSLFQ